MDKNISKKRNVPGPYSLYPFVLGKHAAVGQTGLWIEPAAGLSPLLQEILGKGRLEITHIIHNQVGRASDTRYDFASKFGEWYDP
jgi:hypothetical protein